MAHWMAVTDSELACLHMTLIFTMSPDILKLPPTHVLHYLPAILDYENIYDKGRNHASNSQVSLSHSAEKIFSIKTTYMGDKDPQKAK